MNGGSKILIPLDTQDINKAISIVWTLQNLVAGFKVGLEFISSTYAQMIARNNHKLLDQLTQLFSLIGNNLFYDGKWDDIPNTVSGAASGVLPLQSKFVNVHASAGIEAIKAAVKNNSSTVLGVTVLTSISNDECMSIFGRSSNEMVVKFARDILAAKAGGIICSPQELSILKEKLSIEEFSSLIKVIPGIRPIWAQVGDQKRTMTPSEAIQAGADFLVIGRPITEPQGGFKTMIDALKSIVQEIEEVA